MIVFLNKVYHARFIEWKIRIINHIIQSTNFSKAPKEMYLIIFTPSQKQY